MEVIEKIKQTIRDVPNFPKEGIIFKDIMPLLEYPVLSNQITEELVNQFKEVEVDAIIGIESRGFLFGMAMAMKMNVPFIAVRKKGKLPYKTISYKYDLEYGSAVIEMHVDAVKKDWNVLVHDDLLATGGTAAAAAELIQMQGGKVAGFSFLVGLDFLKGDKKLQQYSENISSLVHY